jgi:chorismate mutase
MKNKSLYKIRSELDNLDEILLNIIKKRTSLVDQVLKVKKFKKDIVDKKRIKIILNRIKKKSIKRKIDTKLTERIWTNMIRSYIDYEFRKFKKK